MKTEKLKTSVHEGQTYLEQKFPLYRLMNKMPQAKDEDVIMMKIVDQNRFVSFSCISGLMTVMYGNLSVDGLIHTLQMSTELPQDIFKDFATQTINKIKSLA